MTLSRLANGKLVRLESEKLAQGGCCCESPLWCVACTTDNPPKLVVNATPSNPNPPNQAGGSAISKKYRSITYTQSGTPPGRFLSDVFPYTDRFGTSGFGLYTVSGLEFWNFSITVPMEPDGNCNFSSPVWAGNSIYLGSYIEESPGGTQVRCGFDDLGRPRFIRPACVAVTKDVYIRFDCCGRMFISHVLQGTTPTWTGRWPQVQWVWGPAFPIGGVGHAFWEFHQIHSFPSGGGSIGLPWPGPYFYSGAGFTPLVATNCTENPKTFSRTMAWQPYSETDCGGCFEWEGLASVAVTETFTVSFNE